MYRRIVPLILTFLISVLVFAGCQQTTKKPVPETQPKTSATLALTLLQVAGKDPYNNGCVSCHKKTADVDRSLPAYVKKISGHPEVREATVNACYVCHERQKNPELYKRFFRGIHKAHWGSETFYIKLKGQCFSCHTVETNGVSGIKNYPLAGYRSDTAVSKTVEQKPVVQKTTESKTPATTPETTKQQGTTGQSGQSQTKTGIGTGTQNEIPTPAP